MLLIKTRLRVSEIHGIGLFADEDVSKGQMIWKYMPNFDIKVTANDLDNLSPPAREQFLNYCYRCMQSGDFVLCFDDARFFNHSENPNVIDDETDEGVVLAARDIKKGEELVCNYKTYDADYQRKLTANSAVGSKF